MQRSSKNKWKLNKLSYANKLKDGIYNFIVLEESSEK